MSKEMTNLEKVKKSCNTAKKLANVISIIFRIGMVMCFVGAGIVFAMHSQIDAAVVEHPEYFQHTDISIELFGNEYFTSADNVMSYAMTCGTALIVAALSLLFGVIVFKIIGKCFKTINESESPFSDEVIALLKKCFIVSTVFIAMSSDIFLGAVVGIVLWCVYTIFQYGRELQQQADETL